MEVTRQTPDPGPRLGPDRAGPAWQSEGRESGDSSPGSLRVLRALRIVAAIAKPLTIRSKMISPGSPCPLSAMAARPLRPCLDCGALTRAGSRCPLHQRQQDRQRGNATQRGYDRQWRALTAAAITAQPWCSWCLHPGSPDNPLTGDHVRPKAAGGPNDASNVRVLCRRCNSSRR